MNDVSSNKIVSVLHPQIKVVGGAMKQMLHLAEFLSKNNDVSFFVFSGNKKKTSQNYSFSITNSFSCYPLKFLSFFIIAWKIRKSNLIFCGNSPMHFVAVISKIIFGSRAKIIWWHHHYPWYHEKNTGIKTYFKKIIENYFVSKVDTIVGNSRFLQKELKSIYKREIQVLYPLVDEVFFDEDCKKEENDDNKKVTKLFVAGRWDTGKGLSDIFHIYEKIKLKFDIHIQIAGIGVETEKYKNPYSNDNNIEFLGELNVHEMKTKFLESDIFLFLSKIDSFGLVIIESLLSNTPVISYNLGEAQFLIKNGENGYLVKNLDEYLEVLIKLLNNEELLQKLKNNSRKSVVSNYSMKNFEKQLVKIIFEK